MSNYRELLRSRGFQAFLWTQFLGALNDNINRVVLIFLAARMATDGSSAYAALVNPVFVVPYLLFSGYAGYLADAASKRGVLVATKAMEVGAAALAVLAFALGRFDMMLAVLFLQALQSVLFSPAKYGILPEMLPEAALSRANGLLEMTSDAAIVLGTAFGGFLFAYWRGELWKAGMVMVAIALVGVVTSLGIPSVARAGSTAPFRLNPYAEIVDGVKRLAADRPLRLTVTGISWFWFFGLLVQMALVFLGPEALKVDDSRTALLLTALALGIGAGGVAAGALSGDRVELGLAPLGAAGLGGFALMCSRAGSYELAFVALVLLGFSGGLFIVPLNALLQHRSGAQEKGRLIAANNVANMAATLAASGGFWLLHDRAGIGAAGILLIFGVITLIGTIWVASLVPFSLVRLAGWALVHTLYRIRATGLERIPREGPALLVANQVSLVDPLLISVVLNRPVRFVMLRSHREIKGLGWFFRLMKTIPISESARDIRDAIRQAREALAAGHLVGIFPEGALSRTGNLLPFQRGFEVIARGLDIPVIPVHLDRVWGSIFSYSGGHILWKRPKHLPYPVTVTFGAPLAPGANAAAARQAVMELSTGAMAQRYSGRDVLERAFLHSAKRNRRRLAIAESSGKELSYGRTLTATLLLARWLRWRTPGEERVGILLPASAAAALANLAVTLVGKVPVNLNFTAGRERMTSAVAQCEIRTILTSRAFVEKAKLDVMFGMIFLEDVIERFTRLQKLRATLASWLPVALLERLYCDRGRTADSVAVIMFTSGTSGTPKGVMLSHRNIFANVEAVSDLYRLTPEDRMTGVLPLFHAFGVTGTLWTPLLNGMAAAYHPDPKEADAVGKLVGRYRTTLLVATPTFLQMYTRRCTREQFASLKHVIAGSERLRDAVAQAFEEKFGIYVLEGYGCTEMSPIVAANTHDFAAGRIAQTGRKPGTVGHPLPGVAVRIVDPDSGRVLGPNQNGLVLLNGPNRMLGYFRMPEKTAEVLRDGWYVTGDIGCLDEDGFLRITDRLSRFSKVGGEMVPHSTVEEHVSAATGNQPCLVIGLPDDHRGERLVAFHTCAGLTAEELRSRLEQSGLPRLWIPKTILYAEALPMLGLGKADLVRARAMAELH